MSQKILIDAGLPGETRVVVVDGEHVEDFDYEQSHRVPIKGNIYLAKVSRVEPSLQAAFVDYGGNRHGFLSFSEIHPDYFRIPVGDVRQFEEEAAPENHDSEDEYPEGDIDEVGGNGEDSPDALTGEEARKRYQKLKRIYKIQEVIKRGQVILVQAVKEERGTKGATVTSYISLAGRFCVLMPNTDRGGGISRKISDSKDRKRLKEIVSDLELPEGMGLIVRTAGDGQNKAEIRRDFAYISDMWDAIRELTLESTAPAKVYEEGNLLKRTIRDLYHKNIDEIVVAGQEAYDACKKLMKALMPSHVKKISHYKGDVPLFIQYKVEEQLKTISDTAVELRSGGFLVLNQTEALVSIDVNSGRAIRERHIEETALQTNLEAVEEIARQLKLRDMAGLIVIDLITMENRRNNKAVENRFRDHLRADRARIQIGRISHFGLLELSRQRIRPSFLESIHERCPMCDGGGYVPTEEFMAQSLVRQLEAEGYKKGGTIVVECSVDLGTHLLNFRRGDLQLLNDRYGLHVNIFITSDILHGFQIKKDDKGAEAEEANEDRGSGKGRRAKKHDGRQEGRHDAKHDGGGKKRSGSKRRGGRRSSDRRQSPRQDDRNYDDRGNAENYDDRSYDDRGYDDRSNAENYDDRGYDDRGNAGNYDDRGHDDRSHDDRSHDREAPAPYENEPISDRSFDNDRDDDAGRDAGRDTGENISEDSAAKEPAKAKIKKAGRKNAAAKKAPAKRRSKKAAAKAAPAKASGSIDEAPE